MNLSFFKQCAVVRITTFIIVTILLFNLLAQTKKELKEELRMQKQKRDNLQIQIKNVTGEKNNAKSFLEIKEDDFTGATASI